MFTLLMSFGSLARKAIEAGIAAGKKKLDLPTIEVAVHAVTKNEEIVHNGAKLLTPALRAKLAPALAHLAYNIAAAETKKPLL